MTGLDARVLNIADLRVMTRRRHLRGLFECIHHGSENEVALHHDREVPIHTKLRSRILVDVSTRSSAMELFCKQQSMVLVIVPTGPTGFLWRRGKVALARAADKVGIPYSLASLANAAMKDVFAEAALCQRPRTALRARYPAERGTDQIHKNDERSI